LIHDERRAPFCWQTHDAIERIRAQVSGPELKTALAVYLSLTYLASVRHAQGGRGGFAAGRKEVAAAAGVKPATFDKVAEALAQIGLLEKRYRTDEVGRDLPPIWVLPEGGPRGTRGVSPEWGEGPPGVPPGDPPKRARVISQEKDLLAIDLPLSEEGGSRGEEEKEAIPDDFPDELRPHARHVMRVLVDLAKRHGARKVSAARLARAIMARPHYPMVRAAHDFAGWADDQPGRRKDVVSGYLNWLDKCGELATTEALPGESPSGPQGNVTPLRRGEHPASRRIREMEQLKQRLREGGTLDG
jgi:hypothetical protein